MTDSFERYIGLLDGLRDEQREAVMSRSPLTVVSAGAGTGKTHTLAQRFAWLILTDEGCDVSSILTLTFTLAAAEEMRERIRSTMISWNEKLGGNMRLKDAIERIDDAYISTMNSFGMRVIREAGPDFDADPTASIVSTAEARDHWEQFAWDLETGQYRRIIDRLPSDRKKWAEDLFADIERYDESHVESFFDFYRADQIASLARDACEVHGSANRTPDFLTDRLDECEREARSAAVEMISPICREIRAEWTDLAFPIVLGFSPKELGTKFGEASAAFVKKWSEPLGKNGEEGDENDDILFVADLFGGPLKALSNSNAQKTIEGTLGYKLTTWRDSKTNKALIKAVSSLTCGLTDEERTSRRLLAGLAALGWILWIGEKDLRGRLTFSDQITFGADVISRDPKFSRRFRHIVVDEFQDTDGTQDAMLRALTAAWEKDDGRTLFVVGDIKQSIYGFRHAEPALYAAYMLEGSAEQIRMSCSFRMNEALMSGINGIFSSIWRDGVFTMNGARALEYEALTSPVGSSSAEKRRSPDVPAVEMMLQTEKTVTDKDGVERSLKASDRREMLGEHIASRIITMIRDRTEIWDKGAGTMRLATLKDIAILVPTRTYYAPLQEAFERCGIPALFSRSKSYYTRGEVRDMIAMLRAFGAPNDAAAIAGWLASPFSGADPSVALIFASKRDRSIDDLRLLAPSCCERYLSMRRAAMLRPPSEMLMQLLADRSWLGAYKNDAERARVMANIRVGAEMLRSYEDTVAVSLEAEVRYLASAMSSHDQEEEPDPYDESDAVRVMTVHSSKGLEFPIVIVFGGDREFKLRADSKTRCFASRELGIVARAYQNKEGERSDSATYIWDSFLAEGPKREEYERELYVALTRARDRVIYAAVFDEGKDRGVWNGLMIDAVSGLGSVETRQVGSDPEPLPPLEMDEAPSPKKAEQGVAAAREIRGTSKMTASSYSLITWCPFAYRSRYRQGLDLKWELPDGDGTGGADLGTLAHSILRRWDMEVDTLDRYIKADYEDDELERETRRISPHLRAAFKSASRRRALRSWLESLASSRQGREIGALIREGHARREISFSVSYRGTELSGAIDLFWEDERGSHIRDWKITTDDGAPAPLYDEQLAFYAFACWKLGRRLPIDAALIHLRPRSGSQEQTIVYDDLDGLERKISRAIELAASGPFDRSIESCGRCPFANKCFAFSRDYFAAL